MEEKRFNYFLSTAPLIAIVAIFAVFKPKELANAVVKVSGFLYDKLDFIILPSAILAFIFCIFIALSKYGSIKLGGENAKKEYSNAQWLFLLVTAGVGVGIVFFAHEGYWHLRQSPYTLGTGTGGTGMGADLKSNITTALGLAMVDWGVPPWSLYCLGGLVISYFAYQKNGDFSISAPLVKAFPNSKFARFLSVAVLIFAIVAVSLSISSSITMATTQVSAGVSNITGSSISPFVILGIIFVLSLIVSIMPIAKARSWLGNVMIYLALFVLAFIFLFGDTHYYLQIIATNVGVAFNPSKLLEFGTNLFAIQERREWLTWYPIAYNIWWLAWLPFVGVFLAKISRGRTIREFVFASIFIPSILMLVWFTIISGHVIKDFIIGSGELAAIADSANYQNTMFALLNQLPLAGFTKIILLALLFCAITSSVSSSTIALGIMTSKNGKTESPYLAALWCILMTLISIAVLISGDVQGIKAFGSIGGVPFLFVSIILAYVLLRQLIRDKGAVK
mgnify:CR=1 FL=1